MKIKDLFEAPKKAPLMAKKVPIKKKAEKSVEPARNFDPNPDTANPNKKVVQTPMPVIQTKADIGQAQKIVQKSGGKKLGSGLFATAYGVPKDVDSVVKISRLNKSAWSADGYFNFVKHIIDKQDNRYLPQIYEVLRMQPEVGDPYLMVNVETLVDGNKLTTEELILVAGKIVSKSDVEVYKIIKDGDYGGPIGKWDILQFISKELSVGAGARGYVNTLPIHDKQLLEALHIINYLKKKQYTIDIHDANFMFRRTPYGPQLVLTDPLAFYSGKVKINTGRPKTKPVPKSKRPRAIDVGSEW